MYIPFYDDLRPDEQHGLNQLDDGWYHLGAKLLPITEEETLISKTGANYSYTLPNNPNKFFCHFNENKKTFSIAETVNEQDHTVWLKNNKNISFYPDNIVLRDNDAKTSEPFQSIEKISQIIVENYSNNSIVKFSNPLRAEQPQFLEQKDGDWYQFGNKLTPLTPEQKLTSKTDANYCFTMPDNDSIFFCHFNEDKKTFFVSETINEKQKNHTVWLDDYKSVAFNNDNITVRYKNERGEPFQNPKEVAQLISKQYKTLDATAKPIAIITPEIVKNKITNEPSVTENTKQLEVKPFQVVLNRIKDMKDLLLNNDNRNNNKNKNSM